MAALTLATRVNPSTAPMRSTAAADASRCRITRSDKSGTCWCSANNRSGTPARCSHVANSPSAAKRATMASAARTVGATVRREQRGSRTSTTAMQASESERSASTRPKLSISDIGLTPFASRQVNVPTRIYFQAPILRTVTSLRLQRSWRRIETNSASYGLSRFGRLGRLLRATIMVPSGENRYAAAY